MTTDASPADDALRILPFLDGMTLREADAALDTARAMAFTVAFVGGTWEQAAAQQPGSIAVAMLIAVECLEGRPLTAISQAVEGARFMVWMERCGALPDSRFARTAEQRALLAAAPVTDAAN